MSLDVLFRSPRRWMQRVLCLSGSAGLALGLSQCNSTSTIRDADVVVSVKDQKLGYYQDGKLMQTYKVSTSKFGLGDKPGSCQTPLGRHEVIAKIGHGLPTGAVLKSRQWNGEVLKPNAPGRDPVVSRIMWLSGMESDNHNALKRYIYIHGTTEENQLGKPASYGCVRMSMSDVVNLFNEVKVGANVVITKDKLPSSEQMAVAHVKEAPPPAAPPASSNPPIPVNLPMGAPGEIHSEYSPGNASTSKTITGTTTPTGKQKLSLPVDKPAVVAVKDVPEATTPKKARKQFFGMFGHAEAAPQPEPEVAVAAPKEHEHSRSSSKKDKASKEEPETAHVSNGKHKPAKTEASKADKKKTSLTLKTPKSDATREASKKHKADVAAVKA